MSVEVVVCRQPTLECFVAELRSRGLTDLVSLEDFYDEPTTSSIVLGKMVKMIHYNPRKLSFIAKEILPDLSYGDHFIVLIEGFLFEPLQEFNLGRGDRMGFCNPSCILVNQDETQFGRLNVKFSIRLGEGRCDRMWCARKAFPHEIPASSAQTSSLENNFASKISRLEFNKSNKTLDEALSKDSSHIPRKKLKISETMSNKDVDDTVTNFNKETNLDNTLQQKPHKEDLPGKKLIEPTNPNYSYKTLADIKSIALDKAPIKVNTFCVVCQILKPLCKTQAGKFTTIIVGRDQTMELVIHFFTIDDSILKQISPGDVLRLHRMQMELFGDDTDGRIFNSWDITLFKRCSIGYISAAKRVVVSESENMKVEELKKWFEQEYIGSLLSNVVNFSDIADEGTFSLFCKIVKEPSDDEECLKLRVTDGTVINNLWPALPLAEGGPPLVTEIIISSHPKEAEVFKRNNYVLFNSVNVKKALSLLLTFSDEGKKKFFLINKENDYVLEIERKIEENSKLAKEQLKSNNITNSNDLQNTNMLTSNINESHSPSNQERASSNNNIILNGSSKKHSYVEAEVEESGISEENTQGKPRKVLFTANNGDWSDATEDVSESTSPLSDQVVKDNSVEILPPANNSISTLFTLLKDQYCSPRRLVEPPSTKDSTSGAKSSLVSSVIGSTHLNKPQDDRDKNNVCSHGENNSVNPVPVEDPDDVETVINLSCHQTSSIPRRKQVVLDCGENMSVEHLTPVLKVSSWLQQNEDEMLEEEDQESELDSVKNLIMSEKDFSSITEMPIITVSVFLESVVPNPEESPNNLISGFCSDGCQNLYIYSSIDWEYRGPEIVPFCPACNKLDKPCRLALAFMFELVVFDIAGVYRRILVFREHAEYFLNCSARDYLTQKSQKEMCKKKLMFLANRQKSRSIRPKFDLSVTFVKNVACLVDTRLKELSHTNISVDLKM